VDFYHANQMLPMADELILASILKDLTTCLPAFGEVKIIDHNIVRLPKAVTHFAPGSYRYLLPATTPIPNVYMSGDWIVTQHGSWSQEKAYVTGLEAANYVVSQFGQGEPAAIIPIEPDEPHVQIGRSLNRFAQSAASTLFRIFRGDS
jgi:uncharacterized protein with NAD-binding domain and iron-sulfur cluster